VEAASIITTVLVKSTDGLTFWEFDYIWQWMLYV